MNRVAVLRHDGDVPDCPVPAERATVLGMVPRVTRLLDWEGDLPDVGEYLETRNGAFYVVIKVTPNTRPNAKSVARLDLLRLDPSDAEEGRRRHGFRWVGSKKKGRR